MFNIVKWLLISFLTINIYSWGDQISLLDTSNLSSVQEQTLDLEEKFIELEEAEFIGLHKITANAQNLSLQKGQSIFFYNLEIKLEKCVRNKDPYKSDDYSLVTLTEYTIQDDPKEIFHGWLSANSISLSTFEHPIYEIFLKKCKNT